jgi:hypothetical protein
MSKHGNTAMASYHEKPKIPRFRRLDNQHILAIESIFKKFPYLHERVEIHMPYHRAKPTFSKEAVWVWQKFDKRPVGYLIFMDGYAPCIWYPDRQEGMTFRWLLPPSFQEQGPTICLANLLTGESVLQIEDILIYQGKDLWSTMSFSQRWSSLHEFWKSLPPDQPLLAFKPRVVKPIPLSEWQLSYNPSIYWIIQPDHTKQQRWYWKDTVDAYKPKEYIAPMLKRGTEIISILCAFCTPYTKTVLPDTYSLFSQEGLNLGIASIPSLDLSLQLRKTMLENRDGFPVEVKWNADFQKYQIMRILPDETPITTQSFFYHKNVQN